MTAWKELGDHAPTPLPTPYQPPPNPPPWRPLVDPAGGVAPPATPVQVRSKTPNAMQPPWERLGDPAAK